ncbi:MAG: hypothetical protein ACKOC5_04675 [Chloroflexota bacterium]
MDTSPASPPRRSGPPSNRSLVQRLGAERYLVISLVAFAGSVIATRAFLSLTGYPQIGNSQLHIAHVLWGGLLLFIGGLLPLVFANASAFTFAAVLNGVGMGLFIDEVGKFITQNNDYFFPAAAPIIYTFFVLTVLLYVYVRRARPASPRQQLYQALHDLGEVLDHDLDEQEHAALQARLAQVISDDLGGNLALLAQSLSDFLQDEQLHLAQARPSRLQLLRERFLLWSKTVNRVYFRSVLIGLLLGSGLIGLTSAANVVYNAFDGRPLVHVLQHWALVSSLRSPAELRWLAIRISLEGIMAALLVAGALLIAARRERTGVEVSIVALVVMLTTVNLLVFYFDQFSAAAVALAQYALLVLLGAYRRWYLLPGHPPHPSPPVDEHAWDNSSIHE